MRKRMLQRTHGIIMFAAICVIHIMIWKLHQAISTESLQDSVGVHQVRRAKRSAGRGKCEEETKWSSFLTFDPNWIDAGCKRQWPDEGCYARRYDLKNFYSSDGPPHLPPVRVVDCEISAPISCWQSLLLTGRHCDFSFINQAAKLTMETMACPIDHCPRLMMKISNLLRLPVSLFVLVQCYGPKGMQQQAVVVMGTHISHPGPFISSPNSSLHVNVLMMSAMSRDYFYNELTRTESFLSKSQAVLDLPLFQHITMAELSHYVEALLSGKNNACSYALSRKLSYFSHNLCDVEGTRLDRFAIASGDVRGNDGNFPNGTTASVSFGQFVCMLQSTGHPVKYPSSLHLAMASHFLKRDFSKGPSLSLTVLNTANITSGRQPAQHNALDQALRDYLREVRSLNKPILTLIIGARGLQPIKLPHSSTWEILQEDNPVLLMLGNHGVWDYVKPLQTSLRSSLMTLWDLNELLGHLMQLDSKVRRQRQLSCPEGFSITSSKDKRTCDSLGVAQPNLCVCASQAVNFSNDTLQVAKAEFALGKLNELIQQQVTNPLMSSHTTSFSRSSYGLCHKLIGVSFSNVSVMPGRTGLRTVLTIALYSPTRMWQSRDTISVTVDLSHYKDQQQMTLVDFSGVQSSSDYKDCRDDRVIQGLCICDVQRPKFTLSRSEALVQFHSPQFGLRPIIINLHQSCLFLGVRNFVSSASFYALNICEDRVYSLQLNVRGTAMVLSSPSPIVRDVPAFYEIFLVVAMQATYYSYPQIWYTHSFSVFYITN